VPAPPFTAPPAPAVAEATPPPDVGKTRAPAPVVGSTV